MNLWFGLGSIGVWMKPEMHFHQTHDRNTLINGNEMKTHLFLSFEQKLPHR
jgi:hypothetical protein